MTTLIVEEIGSQLYSPKLSTLKDTCLKYCWGKRGEGGDLTFQPPLPSKIVECLSKHVFILCSDYIFLFPGLKLLKTLRNARLGSNSIINGAEKITFGLFNTKCRKVKFVSGNGGCGSGGDGGSCHMQAMTCTCYSTCTRDFLATRTLLGKSITRPSSE